MFLQVLVGFCHQGVQIKGFRLGCTLLQEAQILNVALRPPDGGIGQAQEGEAGVLHMLLEVLQHFKMHGGVPDHALLPYLLPPGLELGLHQAGHLAVRLQHRVDSGEDQFQGDETHVDRGKIQLVWISACVSQLGTNFASRYRIHEGYGSKAVTAALASIQGRTCGEILRMACMAAGCYPFADAATGYLAAEPMWASGNRVTLDNLSEYPVMRANEDIAYVQIRIYGESETTVAKFSGTSAASNNTVSVDNPFLHTQAQALTAARAIISTYGGNRIQLSGRGDPASECGDVDSVQLSESAATSARRIEQKFTFRSGVLADLPSTLLQADGTLLYNKRAVLTGSGQWTVPTGVTTVLAILVAGGDAGTDGTDGSFDGAGADGSAGLGGKVLAQSLAVTSGAALSYSCGAGGAAPGGQGGVTTFHTLSSSNGTRYNGYTDIRSGDVYGRDGVQLPLAGSGDGGAQGLGGNAGKRHTVRTTLYIGDGDPETDDNKDNFIPWYQEIVDIQPGSGTEGKSGAAGCIVVWWEEAST